MQDKPHGFFISHSNKDFEPVREVRHWLAQRGHQPLLFFLKCLESEDTRSEFRVHAVRTG